MYSNKIRLPLSECAYMDGLSFAVEIVKAVAWPALGVAGVLLFRPELRSLLAHLKKGKVAGAEFEFEQALLELPGSAQPVAQSLSYTIRLHSPVRDAITESWHELEDAARDLLLIRGVPQTVLPLRAGGLAKVLAELDVFTQDQVGLFLHLRQLSIQASVDPEAEPSAEAATRFVQTADRLKAALDLPTVQA